MRTVVCVTAPYPYALNFSPSSMVHCKELSTNRSNHLTSDIVNL